MHRCQYVFFIAYLHNPTLLYIMNHIVLYINNCIPTKSLLLTYPINIDFIISIGLGYRLVSISCSY